MAPPAIGYDASTWCDVEIRQTNNVITMSINHTLIFAYTNTTVWKRLSDAGLCGSVWRDHWRPEAGAYFANLQVVQLSPTSVTINSITSLVATWYLISPRGARRYGIIILTPEFGHGERHIQRRRVRPAHVLGQQPVPSHDAL